MKFFKIFFLVFLTTIFNCSAQNFSNEEFQIANWSWKLSVPDFLTAYDQQEWKKVQNRGKEAVEDTYNLDLKNKVQTIFIYQAKDSSLFEATIEKFNIEKTPDYIASCLWNNDFMYDFLTKNAPEAQLDTTISVVNVDHIDFQAINLKLSFPDGTVRSSFILRSLFDDMELTVSVIYNNDKSLEKILEVFKKSKFKKE